MVVVAAVQIWEQAVIARVCMRAHVRGWARGCVGALLTFTEQPNEKLHPCLTYSPIPKLLTSRGSNPWQATRD